MKKLTLFLCLLIPTALFSAFPIPSWMPVIAPEVRVGYFRPNGSDFRHIYGHSFGAYDFDLNVRITKRIWGWTGVGYFSKAGENGKDTYIVQETDHCENSVDIVKKQQSRIDLYPVTAGFKVYTCVRPYVDAYAGIGARWTYMRIHNFGHGPEYATVRKSLGVAVIAGFRMILENCIYATPFVEYSNNCLSRKKCLKNETARRITKIGGFKFGLGLGIAI